VGVNLQERIESSDLGRALISAFVIVTLLVIFASNLPRLHDSELKRKLSRIGTPYLGATGIDQSWSVFAPEPVKTNNGFTALVTFRDGNTAQWQAPQDDRFLGAFREGRWSKWLEVVRNPIYTEDVLKPAAAWIARRYATDGRRPVRVTFIRAWQDIPAPGSELKNLWHAEAYYTLDVTPAILSGDPPA
jgi:hypothetical protein